MLYVSIVRYTHMRGEISFESVNRLKDGMEDLITKR